MPIKQRFELEADLDRAVERAARVRDAVAADKELRSQAEPAMSPQRPVDILRPVLPIGKT